MGVGDESEGADGLDGYVRTTDFQLVLAVAEALRQEFGAGIDAHPGGKGNEAGVVNRSFRAMARAIVAQVISPTDDPAAVLTWVLREAAIWRLAELGVGQGAVALLDSEPSLGDRWLAYLALAPFMVINDLLTQASGGTDQNSDSTPE